MGHISHNAILVTSWNEDAIRSANLKAVELDLTVAGPSPSPVNGYLTLCICPDGSKTGWPERRKSDEKRTQFRDWLRSQCYEDGSSCLEWCEVSYGNDDRKAAICDTAWRRKFLVEVKA